VSPGWCDILTARYGGKMAALDEIAAEVFILSEAIRLVAKRTRDADLLDELTGLADSLGAAIDQLLKALDEPVSAASPNREHPDACREMLNGRSG